MFTPEAADTISRLSAFALFVFLSGLIGVGLYRRWWVFGWQYQQERDGRLTAETQAERNAKALEDNNSSLATLSKTVEDQGKLLTSLRRELRGVRSELRRGAVSAGRNGA